MNKIIIPILMFFIGYVNQAKAEDTDLNTIDNVIYVAADSVNIGETAELSICMKNTTPIRGFQFNFYMPAGVNAVKSSKGRIQATLSKERLDEEDEHTLSVSEQEDGSLLFLCGSEYPETFTGNEGIIAVLKIKVDETLSAGEYPIVLKNVKLSETNISKFYLTELLETTLTIMSNTTGITTIQQEKTDSRCYNLSGQLTDKKHKGLFIVNRKKVVVK